MSGGFLWSDEFPERNSKEWLVVGHDDIYRYLLAVRREVTLGRTERENHPLWQQVIKEAPK